jgi:cytochrome c556
MDHFDRLRVWMAAAIGGIVIWGACANQQSPNQPPQQAQLAQAVSAPKRQQPPKYLSPIAREILRTRMASHAREMRTLMAAVMVLDYPKIAEGSERIASDANLSRPLTGDATELNSALPEKFFVHQDEVRAQARALANATQTLDPYRIAAAYGRLSEACVSCHAVYREGI